MVVLISIIFLITFFHVVISIDILVRRITNLAKNILAISSAKHGGEHK